MATEHALAASRIAESALLHGRVRALIDAYAAGDAPTEPFEQLAQAIGRHQAAHHPAYARLCARHGVTPHTALARELPAIPTDAFKLARIATFPEAEAVARFRTSGTTVGTRGQHDLRDLGSYDRGALAFGRRSLLADARPRRVLVLGPSPAQAPDSSLTHMNGLFVRELSVARDPRTPAFFLDGDLFDLAGLDQAVAEAQVAGQPVLLLGTSFAFVHLLDALGAQRFALPEGSCIMQTGGFKGRSREVSAPALRAQIAEAFALDPRAVVQEYGMTELSSQFYEHTAVRADAAPGVLCEPPWARVVPVDPSTLAPVAGGEIGIARIEDLCNVDSAFAIQTADRVRRVDGGFELLGRLPGATPRGCSIAIDELLAGGS